MTQNNTQQPSFFESMPIEQPCFIETQFPVAKISAESYKERKGVSTQTLTGLGKWWGRKPLILVRAALLGLLIPASSDPEKDREIFLKLLTMDRKGLSQRKSKPIPSTRLAEELSKLPPGIQTKFSAANLTKAEKEELQKLVFERLPYSEKLEYCDRPEQIDGPSPETWEEINAHLGTHSKNLPELVQELGERRFGHHPRVGDAFCGGGSIPFEAARLGCDVYGSDLNPVAALLTWASLNLVGGGEEVAAQVRQAQEEIYHAVDQQVTEWGIEHNSLGWRADAYLYCVEVIDPETGWKVPMLPTLAIAPKQKVIARLVPDEKNKRFEIEIIEGVTDTEYVIAQNSGTVKDSRLVLPQGGATTPVELIRNGLRLWNKQDFAPLPEDIFQERLYCIRWLEPISGKAIRHYRSPNHEDLLREQKVEELLSERFGEWQEMGFIPSRKIEPGSETTRLQRERGWTYWHHLFTPRQLLFNGYISSLISKSTSKTGVLFLLGKIIDRNSKLSVWHSQNSSGIGSVERVFSNQALNTLYNFGCRPTVSILSLIGFPVSASIPKVNNHIDVVDAKKINSINDFWITDPPYADAVNYEEISEFFLAWYEKHISNSFSSWYTDSKRALAVKGNESGFRKSMVDCYNQMTKSMPNDGMQIVMFTHQDAAVWADLTMILWAAGLRVTAAWTIATETEASGIKKGNYVQGTVLLVLRKRIITSPLFLDEISHRVEDEVRRQLDSMTRLEDASDPNFGDADYQLAAYAAALRVLTGQPIEEIDPEKEILRERKPGEIGPVEALIRRAVKIACDHLIPRGLNSDLWKSLGAMERFYIKGLEVESHGEYRSGVYQELARGFGANDYTDLLESTKANETRLKTASEFGKKGLGTFGSAGDAFNDSLVRQCLFSIWLTVKNEGTKEGMDYLHTDLREAYWINREKIIGILEYMAALRHSSTMEHWKKDGHAAGLLAGAVRNDHV